MKSFVALYRGETIASAKLVAVSADSDLVTQVCSHLLATKEGEDDPVAGRIERGRRGALRLIKAEAARERGDPGPFQDDGGAA